MNDQLQQLKSISWNEKPIAKRKSKPKRKHAEIDEEDAIEPLFKVNMLLSDMKNCVINLSCRIISNGIFEAVKGDSYDHCNVSDNIAINLLNKNDSDGDKEEKKDNK